MLDKKDIKAYVRKFGNDVIKGYKPQGKNDYSEEYTKMLANYAWKKEVIGKWVKLYEYGYISYVEAMRKICEEA